MTAAPLRGPAHPRWKGDRVGYRGAHLRVVRERGRADGYLCVDCQGPATGWSLKPDADLRALTFDDRLYAFATDPALYEPRCQRCHGLTDWLVRTGEVPAQIRAAGWLVSQLTHVYPDGQLVSVLRAEAAGEGITAAQLAEGRRRYTDVQSIRVPGVRGVRRWILPGQSEGASTEVNAPSLSSAQPERIRSSRRQPIPRGESV